MAARSKGSKTDVASGVRYTLSVAGGNKIAHSQQASTLAPQALDLLQRGYPVWIRAGDKASAKSVLALRLVDGVLITESTTGNGGHRDPEHWDRQIITTIRNTLPTKEATADDDNGHQ